ncbi:phage tail protein [Escherichia coli]|uniref:phage tail assembly protein T n=1 Tax=Escherichia coli TaxID=562 RepID=UPI002D21B9EC|nr:phage tail protein [Escherichia coli]
MLNGIGGRTIAEAQARLSFPEYRLWLQYRQKYGSLNPMLRAEWCTGLLASVTANMWRSSQTPPFLLTDFTPHIDEPPVSLEEAMKQWD